MKHTSEWDRRKTTQIETSEEEATEHGDVNRPRSISSIYGDDGDPTLAVVIDENGRYRFLTVGVERSTPDFDDFFPETAPVDRSEP